MRQRGLVCLLLSCWCVLSGFVWADTTEQQERVELKFWQVPKEVRRNVRLAYPFHLYRDWAKEGAIYSVRIISTDYQMVYFDSTGEWLRAYRPVRWSELPYNTYLFLKEEFKAYRMLRAYLVQQSDDLAYYTVKMEHRKIYSLISHMEFDFVGNLTMLDGEVVGGAAEETASVAPPAYVHGSATESLMNPNWREANADVYDAAAEEAAWKNEPVREVAKVAEVNTEVAVSVDSVVVQEVAAQVSAAAVDSTAVAAVSAVGADTVVAPVVNADSVAVVVDTAPVGAKDTAMAAPAKAVAMVAADTTSGFVGTRPVASVVAATADTAAKPVAVVRDTVAKIVVRDTVKPAPTAVVAPAPVQKPTARDTIKVARDTAKVVPDTIKVAPQDTPIAAKDTAAAIKDTADVSAPVQDSAALAVATESSPSSAPASKKYTGPQYMIPFPNFLISPAEVLDSVSKAKALALADTALTKPLADTTLQATTVLTSAETTASTTSSTASASTSPSTAVASTPIHTSEQTPQPDTVICPEIVTQTFKKRFPAAEKTAWRMADSLYVVSFNQAGQAMMAAYREDGMHIYTAYAFSRNEMPLPIDRYLETEARKMKMTEGWHVMYESKYKRMFAVADRPKDYYYVVMGQKIPKTKTWQYTCFTFNQNAQFESKSTYEKSFDK